MTKYTFKDHGTWIPYTPDVLPEWAAIMSTGGPMPAFLKRVEDNVDWYDYRNKEGQFATGSVLFCTLYHPNDNNEVVKSVFNDPSKVFPANQRLVEVNGVPGDETKPHNLFAEMIYDPKTKTLSGEPGIKLPQKTIKKDLWSRASDEEVDAIEEWLDQQPTRQKRIFNDTLAIDHSEPLYEILLEAFTNLFGVHRATELLSLSK